MEDAGGLGQGLGALGELVEELAEGGGGVGLPEGAGEEVGEGSGVEVVEGGVGGELVAACGAESDAFGVAFFAAGLEVLGGPAEGFEPAGLVGEVGFAGGGVVARATEVVY